jgi:multiple sugar transport system substrate-binding protein
MAWNHPRAIDPLEAISAAWAGDNDCPVQWDARPLKDFEDQPLEELADRYDLILIDYPFVGTAAESGLIVPAEEWTDHDYLADQAASSVGPSYASYTWQGRQWALAVDAACQVSGARTDLLDASTAAGLPESWEHVLELADALRGSDSRIAVPLNPNHAYCAFLSLGIGHAGPDFWRAGERIDRDAALSSLEFLRELSTRLHPLSRDADPIAISDCMSTTGEILYVPLMFGYSSYARQGFRANRIRFADAPRGSGGHIGSVLGGVGIALSARSANRPLAADLARLIASREIQTRLYASAGGQPGHAAAWESSRVNAPVDGFFTSTRRTIGQAFLRPRVPGHRRFQVEAGELIHRFLWGKGMSAEECCAEFNRRAGRLLGDWQDGALKQTAGATR